MLQKDVQSVKFTAGYIWTLGKNGHVYQWPIIKKFDENNQIVSKQLGEKR